MTPDQQRVQRFIDANRYFIFNQMYYEFIQKVNELVPEGKIAPKNIEISKHTKISFKAVGYRIRKLRQVDLWPFLSFVKPKSADSRRRMGIQGITDVDIARNADLRREFDSRIAAANRAKRDLGGIAVIKEADIERFL